MAKNGRPWADDFPNTSPYGHFCSVIITSSSISKFSHNYHCTATHIDRAFTAGFKRGVTLGKISRVIDIS
jgi:hypothetical protein